MDIKSTDLIALFEQSLQGISHEGLEEAGVVVQVGDGVCKVHGLSHAVFGELLAFDGGNKGIIFNLEEDIVAVFLLYASVPVAELEAVKRTGSVFKTPVGNAFLGRVINALGQPLDGLDAIKSDEMRSVEATPPGIIERSPVNESLETGILAVVS